MAKKLGFKRKLADARPFEKDALNAIAAAIGLGYQYPIDKLVNGRLEAQMTRPKVPVDTSTIDVFFLLEDYDGRFNIEIALQPLAGVWPHGGTIWAFDNKAANVTLENEVVNDRFVLTSIVDGNKMRYIFFPEYGRYFPEELGARKKAIDLDSRRRERSTRKAA